MYLVMAIEHFPDSEPVTTLEIRDRQDDAVMLARCMRDEARSVARHAVIEVFQFDRLAPIQRFAVSARPKRSKRGCKR